MKELQYRNLLVSKVSSFMIHFPTSKLCSYTTDLVPREAVEKWLKYLREELPTVAFKCSTQEQRSNLGWKSAPKTAKASKATTKSSNLLQTSDCLGAETLIKLLKNYSRSHEVWTDLCICYFDTINPIFKLQHFVLFNMSMVCDHGCSVSANEIDLYILPWELKIII